MKAKANRIILLFITITIVATIGLQLHWNIKNYEENKRQLRNEIQIAFDTSIENYYAEGAKKDIMTFSDDSVMVGRHNKNINVLRTLKVRKFNGRDDAPVRISDGPAATNPEVPRPKNISMKILKSGNISNMKDFANRIIISMFRDSIALDELDKALKKELGRKNIHISYGIEQLKMDTVTRNFKMRSLTGKPWHTLSKSTYLPPGQQLKLWYSDPTLLVLKRSFAEIILSLLLSLSIIGCLLYLLKIINRQKKIDEIKNDLISNITHEFKTPITTIATAMEGIRNFNAINDAEKTSRYLDISGQQLSKLETMVEKLLETASLQTDALVLHKESVDVVALLKNLVDKYQEVNPSKNISFTSKRPEFFLEIDVFHFENAVANVVDNAIKYGGNTIHIDFTPKNKQVEITISDDGDGIAKPHREKIFDQFYRIPKGNIHDVKGFGIGLYYARKIIEKQGGRLVLDTYYKTVFKISLDA